MRKLIALSSLAFGSLGLIGAAPPPSVDARLRAIVQPVSAAQLRHTIESLVSFGTRHTLSSQTDPRRGIGAALNWGQAQFQADGLPAQRVCDTFSGERLPGLGRIAAGSLEECAVPLGAQLVLSHVSGGCWNSLRVCGSSPCACIRHVSDRASQQSFISM